jgi:hypothetical protein
MIVCNCEKRPEERATDGEDMTGDSLTRIRAIIEEELGEFRPFGDLPATEIEAMADRLTRTLAPLVGAATVPTMAKESEAA